MRPTRVLPSPALSLALVLASAPALAAQCSHAWLSGYGCPGTNGVVFDAVGWDPDGAGPTPPVVALGGDFTLAGDVPCAGVATWNPAIGAIAALPAPPLPFVHRLAVAGNGHLLAVVGGYVGGLGCWQVAAFGAAGWTNLGNGFAQAIRDLHVRPTGEIVIAGQLDPFGGGTSLGVAARWTGSAWVSLGGAVGGVGWALSDLANGDLAVGTNDAIGGVPVSGYYAWNGTTLTPFPGTGPVGVSSFALAPTGELFAYAAGLWSWNGTVWAAHVPPASAALTFWSYSVWLGCTANGDVLVAGHHNNSWFTDTVASYTPTTGAWNVLRGTFNSSHIAFVDAAGSGPLAVGDFTSVDGRSLTNVARWSGGAWQPLRDGAPSWTECVAPLAGDRLAVGGSFASCGSIATANVAEWTGSSWAPMGQGLDSIVRALLRLPNGDLLAGGDFTASGPVAASALARWNGTAWSQFGGGVSNGSGQPSVRAIAAMPNGDVVVAGTFTAAGGVPAVNVALWDGASWWPFGAGAAGTVSAIAVAPDGDVWLVREAPGGPTEVQQWDGSTWTTVASYGSSSIFTLAVLTDGTLVLAGLYHPLFAPSVSFVDVRDPGLTWSRTTANNWVTEVVAAPDGDALVFGYFTQIGPIQAPGMARWHGGAFPAWSAGVPSAGFHDAVFTAGGELVAAGVAGLYSQHSVARLATTCPASANAYGSGCTGSGGSNLLHATSLPWLGAVFSTVATGMAANGIVVRVLGFGTGAVPLASILPQGVAGCTLLVTPDLLDAYVPTAGVVTSQLAIPNVPALVNQTLHQQFVSLELTAGAITALTSTNALTVTIGDF